jgi:hypothetical protein
MQILGFRKSVCSRSSLSRAVGFAAQYAKGMIGIALLGGLLASQSYAHELESNRVTLVQRDSQHLALTFYIDYVDAVYDILAPERPFEEFVMLHSAMPLAGFKLALDQAHKKLVADTQLSAAGGKALAISNWRWPDAARVHDSLKQRAMQLVVGAGQQHAHATVFEVQAEVTSVAPITAVSVKLPAVIQPALLVWYRPQQVLIDSKLGAKTVRF